MTPPFDHEDDDILLHAYADGELDAAGALAFERRMAASPALASRCETLRALAHAVRAAAPTERASPQFLRRLTPAPARFSQPSWLQMAMAACFAALVASGGTFFALQHNQPDEVLASLVSAHMRGLASPVAIDVASSDRHTVKPWFDGRLAFSPQVLDLSGDGFPLLGGRVDAVGGQLAATMVYRYQNHTLTLTQARTAALPATVLDTARSRDGYVVLAFSSGDLTCWLVTDLPLPQARSFVLNWQRQKAGA